MAGGKCLSNICSYLDKRLSDVYDTHTSDKCLANAAMYHIIEILPHFIHVVSSEFLPQCPFWLIFPYAKSKAFTKIYTPGLTGMHSITAVRSTIEGFPVTSFHHILIPHKHRKPSIPVSFKRPSQIPV